jgi:Flp pilus assembly protein TadG
MRGTTAFRTRLHARLRRFSEARGGAAAVEFAMISVPFLLLLFGIVELSLVFLLSTTLDNAASEAARTIRTGELQTNGGGSASTFKASICDNLGWLKGDCVKNLYVDVRTFATFAAVTAPQPIVGGKFDASKLQFTPGAQKDIVVVRAYYKWPFITPMVSKAMQQLSDGSMLMMSTVTFRNEPYGS